MRWRLPRLGRASGRHLRQVRVLQGLCGVVSFSDPVPRRTAAGTLVFPGHIGTIYQASNAEYLGRRTPCRILLPEGRLLSPACSSGWASCAARRSGAGALRRRATRTCSSQNTPFP
jgi:hypothetical protein